MASFYHSSSISVYGTGGRRIYPGVFLHLCLFRLPEHPVLARQHDGLERVLQPGHHRRQDTVQVHIHLQALTPPLGDPRNHRVELLWGGGSVLELSPGHAPLLLQVYLGQVRAPNWGSGRDKRLRAGPVMFPALAFYPQMRTRRNQE